ncbi:aliphatic sulfonate ABC transporter ATP-binding protein [Neobacillus piezotolerans]|uniref:Aliphatic sulfonate ABC transporter ATP-binding protein n=1 Tax=Neobacillus piezotolerans TaxID=2259171 RepID=A0A3D8GQH2_9BACI|nr:aliphatic sulfonate ABC transporter ATP-binding protein [Neobacillus piezotolerans]
MKQGKAPYLLLKGVKKHYGDRIVLDGIDFLASPGEFISIVGKSGCGKSTLLRLIAGLEEKNDGKIFVKGEELKGINTHARIMFQDGRLLPWKSILKNIGIGLNGHWGEKAIQALRNVGLEDRGGDWPSKLSGGQKQRVALARALVHEPEILLLDEPLGALDALTRVEMQDLIERLWTEKGFTAILVTHDVEEAVAIADRVILIEEGKIVMNRPIDLPRPRQRSQRAFHNYVEDILERILGPNGENGLKLVGK